MESTDPYTGDGLYADMGTCERYMVLDPELP